MRLAAAPRKDRLGGHVVDVVLGLVPVDILEGVALRVPLHGLLDAHAQREALVRLLVCLEEVRLGELPQAPDGLVDGGVRKGVRLALVFDLVEGAELLVEHLGEQGRARVAVAEVVGLRGRQPLVAELLQQPQGRPVGVGLLVVRIDGHRTER